MLKRKIKDTNPKDVNDIDRNIGARINYIRLAMGVTRRELSNSVGVTHQQLQKYEKGINRLSVGRLIEIASALGADVSSFFENIDGFAEGESLDDVTRQRFCMEVMKDFLNIKNTNQQDAIRKLIKVLAAK